MHTDTNESKQLPLALVHGDAVTDKPLDLFIPPDALEVFLDSFEGPLDFLLYLIRKQKFDILNLPIMEITLQYTEYIEIMENSNLELASDYLVMAAILAEIKSRMLLPVINDAIEDEDDPRAELLRQLIEYEKFKIAAENLDHMPRLERDTHSGSVEVHEDCVPETLLPEIAMKDLAFALLSIIKRADNFQSHHIKKESLSTRSRMAIILEKLNNTSEFLEFSEFFTIEEGRAGIVVTFLAILELVKEQILDITQNAPLSPVYIRKNQDPNLDLTRVT